MPPTNPAAARHLLLALIAAFLAGALAFAGIQLDRRGYHAPVELRVLRYAPTGTASSMQPVVVSFAGAVDRTSAERDFAISPSLPGSFAWAGADLRFTPAWPGFARGTTYQVSVGSSRGRRVAQWSFQAGDELTVQSTAPADNDAGVDTQALVLVQFNRPVAPLTDLNSRNAAQMLSFSPSVAGSGRWLTSQTYTFRPSAGLAPSTSYTVRVPQDLGGAGGMLAADYSFGFATVLPAVADTIPRDNTQFADPTADVKVLFNQPMDPASTAAAFSLNANGQPVAGNVSFADAQTLVFHPGAALPRRAMLNATVAAGAQSAGGTVQSQAPYTWHFSVIPAPAVVKSDPGPGQAAAGLFSATLTFSAPMDHDATEGAISIDPAPDADSKPIFFWGQDTAVRINYPFQASKTYRISVGASARDRYGVALAQPFSVQFTTQPLAASASVVAGDTRTSGEGTLSAAGPSVVYTRTTNAAQVNFSLYTLTQTEFTQLSGSNSGDRRRAFQAGTGSQLRNWSVPIANQQLNTVSVTPVDLAPDVATAVDGKLVPGFYLLDEAIPNQNNSLSRTVLEVTRTNLVVKRGPDSIFVWAADITSGQPLANVPATITDDTGATLASGATDGHGIFTAALKPLAARDTRTFFAGVVRDGDVALATDAWYGTVSSLGSVSVPSSLRGYLFTDRPIYRTGETVHIALVLRSDHDGQYTIPSDTSDFTLEVRDGRGQMLQSSGVQLDPFGYMSVDAPIPDAGATGFYGIALSSRSGSGVNANGGFQVAEFRMPEFAVAVKTNQPSYINGATISADVQADLFLGAPLANGQVTYTVNSFPYAFQPQDKQFAGFSFGDPDLVAAQKPAPKPAVSGATQTDSSGHATFNLPADLGDYPTSVSFSLSATVTDTNRQQVSASQTVVVHKAALYGGVKPRQYLGSAGQASTFDIASVDTAGRASGNVPLKASIYRRTYTTAKQRDPDGSEHYVSTPNDTLVTSQNVTTDSNGTGDVSFTPDMGGQYRIVLQGTDSAGNTFQSATSIYVTSNDLLAWKVNNNGLVDLIADRDEYAPGDVAHILVPAPFDGATGLVTVERGRVISHMLHDFPTNSTVVDIPITDEMAPTVYVAVALLKPGGGPDGVAAFRVGSLRLKISPAKRALTVQLSPSTTSAHPGDTISVAVKTMDSSGTGVPAELALALVDQAVLSLVDAPTSGIFEAFNGDRFLNVSTGATLGISINVANQAVAALAQGSKGGSGGGGDQAGNIRSNFQNTAYWNAAIRTDAGGNASVSFTLPDNLTTFRLLGVGATSGTLTGQGTGSISTTRDLVLRPVAPRFFVQGDQAHLEATLNNRTNAPLDVTVSLTADGLTVSGGAQRVTVPANGTAQAGWDTQAGSGATAKVTWQANASNGLADGMQLTLPIADRTTQETVASAGDVPATGTTESVVIPAGTPQTDGSITLQLSTSLDALLAPARQYLEGSRYSSVDVLAAKLLERVGVYQTAQKLQKSAADQASARAAVVDAIGSLAGDQGFNGGWSWWPGGASVPRISAQALYALSVAKRAGIAVDGNVLAQAAKYLNGEYDKPSDAMHPADPNQQAFVLLAIANLAQDVAGKAQALYSSQRAALGGSGKGALLQTLLLFGRGAGDGTVRSLVDDLTGSALTSAAGTHWEDAAGSGSYTNSTWATALALAALLQLDPQQPQLDGAVRWLAGARREGYWSSVDETGLAVSAVSAFATQREQPSSGLSFSVMVNGQAVGGSGQLAADATGTTTITVPLSGLPTGTPLPIAITRQGDGQLYYALTLRYAAPVQGATAASNGITVGHDFLSASDDTPVTAVQAGDLVRIRVTVVAPADLQFVRVDDLLPAGFEAVDNSLKTTDPSLISRQQQDLLQALMQPGAKQPDLRLVSDRDRRLIDPFDHVEVRDDRVALFATSLSKGVHEYIYHARATTAGQYAVLPSHAEQTTFPDIFGRGDSTTVTITR